MHASGQPQYEQAKAGLTGEERPFLDGELADASGEAES
jgi:hypothetical protein